MSTEKGYRFAYDCVLHTVSAATAYITQVRKSAELRRPLEINFLESKERSLSATHRLLSRQVAAYHHRVYLQHGAGSGAWSLTVSVALIIGAFLFAAKAIEDFHLGWMGQVYCCALAFALPYSSGRFLEEFPQPIVRRIFVFATFSISLATVILFGMLRGEILAHSLNAEAAIVIDGLGIAEPSADDSARIVGSLRLVWGLAALAFELASGIGLHAFREARRKTDFATLSRLEKALLKVETEILSVTQRLHELLSEPARTEAAFWENFERGLHDGAVQRKSMGKIAGILLAVFISAQLANAADRLHLIAAVDMSKTQEAKGYNGKSEFRENIGAVSTILAGVPAGTRVAVIGITDRSFVNPMVLLEARTTVDPGAFSSRIIYARRRLLSEWKSRSATLQPSFNKTDIVGALQYAGAVLAQSEAQRKVIVILSDGRNYTTELDLETPRLIDRNKALKQIGRQELFAALLDTEVFFLGAGDHTGNRGTAYATGLKTFWTEFVQRSGGRLGVFSTSREADALRAVTSLPAKTDAP